MPPRNPVRRSQLVSTFGVGGLFDTSWNESFMIAGLDVWPFARQTVPDDWQVVEERLAGRLRVGSLRLPPDYREGPGTQHPHLQIPAVRFPRWHYCPRCGSMEFVPLFEPSRRRCPAHGDSPCGERARNRRPFLLPVRLVSVCPEGHIQDFPFLAWCHGGSPGGQHRLIYQAMGSSAALSGILIRCTDCQAQRTLRGSFEFNEARGGPLTQLGEMCRGARPWLGESGGSTNQCGQHLRVLQRGASNVFFPFTVSSIYLPLWAEDAAPQVIRILEDQFYWDILTSGLIDGSTIDPDKADRVGTRCGVDPAALQQAAQRRLDGAPDPEAHLTEEEYRRSEYGAFIAGRGGENTDLLVEVADGDDYAPPVRGLLRSVCLVRKLRETRALAGFTRILPAEDIRDPRIQPLSSRHLGWLPATVVRGEGIFLEFEGDRLAGWAGDHREVGARAHAVAQAYNRKRIERGLEPRQISAKFLFLHTFAHILLKQLSFDCGYGSAALRERLYCETEPQGEPMQGILIYTASGDSEGTLGGLVRQGEPGRLEQIVQEAVRGAYWCSSDPVCIESPGQGAENANLAACHACALVSETSCEEGNRLLDRGMVVGTIRDRSIGVFSSI